ncbi:hypothetical protein Hanom_Chr05g00460051 [Helianthus anomalus]
MWSREQRWGSRNNGSVCGKRGGGCKLKLVGVCKKGFRWLKDWLRHFVEQLVGFEVIRCKKRVF